MIRLGGIAKLAVVAVAAYEVMSGNISWQFVLLASADLLFAVLFFLALGEIGEMRRTPGYRQPPEEPETIPPHLTGLPKPTQGIWRKLGTDSAPSKVLVMSVSVSLSPMPGARRSLKRPHDLAGDPPTVKASGLCLHGFPCNEALQLMGIKGVPARYAGKWACWPGVAPRRRLNLTGGIVRVVYMPVSGLTFPFTEAFLQAGPQTSVVYIIGRKIKRRGTRRFQ